jgi:N-acetylglucosamine-6-sulfatase
MRKTVLVFASVALAIVLSLGAYSCGVPAAAQTSPPKPNFVFILADDMRYDDLKYMPKTRSALEDRGMTFANAYVSFGLCCPSRATILRGQYAHNTGVWTNGNRADSSGGWQAFRDNGHEQDNLATRLNDAGYRTALLGKYLNNYDGSVVPPGWDRWFAAFDRDPNEDQAHYYDYSVNDNGTTRHFGSQPRDYMTDVMREETLQFIDDSAGRGEPFFAYVAPRAPHGPPKPAPRDENTFDGLQAPRLPSFNENDVSDKPPWIRSLRRLDDTQKAQIDAHYEGRVETLQALDDLVQAVVKELSDTGVLQNTYVVFASDNGWQLGEHRIVQEKRQPYEESIHVPLLVRGPGVPANATTHKLVLNTDYFPTFTALAGATTPDYVDGRSLRPVLGGSTTATWRTAILLERAYLDEPATWFEGILTSDERKYIEYAGGFRESYDLGADPYELRNSYDAATPPARLAARLQALKGCAGDSCRAAENGR